MISVKESAPSGLSMSYFAYKDVGGVLQVYNGSTYEVGVNANISLYRIGSDGGGVPGVYLGQLPDDTEFYELRQSGANFSSSIRWANGVPLVPGINSGITTLLSRITSSRSSYLDNLNIGTLVASSGQVSNLPSGVWTFSNRTVTSGTIQDIDNYLAGRHGSGAWDATNIIGDVASGVWNFNNRALTSGTVQDIGQYLSLIHGSGFWETAIPVGSYVVNVITKDSSNLVAGGAVVEVRPSGSNNLLDIGSTNMATGQAVFNLNNGAYDFYAYRAGSVRWQNPSTRVITTDQTIILTGTDFTIVPPSNVSGLVTIYGFFKDISLTPVQGIEMIVTPSGTEGTEINDIMLVSSSLSVLSDSDGFASMNIAANTPVRILVPKTGFDKTVMSPIFGSTNINDL